MAGIKQHYKSEIRTYKRHMLFGPRPGTRGPSGRESGRLLKKKWKNYFLLRLSSQSLLSSKHLVETKPANFS